MLYVCDSLNRILCTFLFLLEQTGCVFVLLMLYCIKIFYPSSNLMLCECSLGKQATFLLHVLNISCHIITIMITTAFCLETNVRFAIQKCIKTSIKKCKFGEHIFYVEHHTKGSPVQKLLTIQGQAIKSGRKWWHVGQPNTRWL